MTNPVALSLNIDADSGVFLDLSLVGAPGPAGPEGPAGGGVPSGGTTGQVLAKASDTDQDVEWVTPAAGGDIEIADVTGLQSALDGKQATLVSGTNIKTVGGTSLLGSGDIPFPSGGSVVSTDISDSTAAGRSMLTAADAAAQRTLLSVETTSQLNSRDTANRDRANHTGTQLAATISDFSTAVAATAAVTANTAKVSNATHTGDVTGDTALTIANDAVTNAKLANMSAHSVKVRVGGTTGDPSDLVLLASQVVGRASSGDITGLSASQLRTITSTETTTELNTRDTNNRARANHTGTQLASTISDFDTAADARITASNKVSSDTTGITGADQITNMVSLTQAEFDAIGSPDGNTLYVIV